MLSADLHGPGGRRRRVAVASRDARAGAQPGLEFLGLDGAAFPWRTIHGEEASGYWPAGTAAFHVNADIADAIVRYQAATDDARFERETGLELLDETARLWASLGHRDATGRLHIDGVTGPDEYSAIADNNIYTNLMAQRNLRAAADAVERHPDRAAALGAVASDAASWRDTARAVVAPYDDELGVHCQAEGFTRHERWDFEATGPDRYPLLLHYPTSTSIASRSSSRPTSSSHCRCGEAFTDEEKARDFAYYEALTVRLIAWPPRLRRRSRRRWATTTSSNT